MYAKVFEQIFDSSIAEDWQVRIVFEDFLKMCDKDGVVDKTPEAISRRSNVPLDIVRHAISILEQPDPRSRRKDHDGRRIIRLDDHRDWGWMITNYAYYRAIASEEQRRETTRDRVKKHREEFEESISKGISISIRESVTDVPLALQGVTGALQTVTPALHKPDKRIPESLEIAKAYGVEIGMPAADVESFYDHFASNGWKVSGKAPMKDWKAAMRNWHRNSAGYVRAPSNRTPVPPAKIDYSKGF